MSSGAPQLDLATVLPESNSITVFDTVRCDGNFLILHYLVTSLAKGRPVILVTVAQIFNHYNLAAKKLVWSPLSWETLKSRPLLRFSFVCVQGFNLAAPRDSGMLSVIDGVTNLQGWNSAG